MANAPPSVGMVLDSLRPIYCSHNHWYACRRAYVIWTVLSSARLAEINDGVILPSRRKLDITSAIRCVGAVRCSGSNNETFKSLSPPTVYHVVRQQLQAIPRRQISSRRCYINTNSVVAARWPAPRVITRSSFRGCPTRRGLLYTTVYIRGPRQTDWSFSPLAAAAVFCRRKY